MFQKRFCHMTVVVTSGRLALHVSLLLQPASCLSTVWSTQAISTDGCQIQISPQQHARCALESCITASSRSFYSIDFHLCGRQLSVTPPRSPISGSSSASVSPWPSRVPSPFSHPATDQEQGIFCLMGK